MRARIELKTPDFIKNAQKDASFCVLWAKTDDGIEILLDGVVGDEYTQSDASSIKAVLRANRNAPVTLRVNSPGGLAFDGLQIHNAIADHSGPTTGIIESLAASAASLAVIGADKVVAYDNSVLMIHEGIAGVVGHIADLQEAVEWLEAFNDAAITAYVNKSGKDREEVAKAMLGENGDGTKFTAQQAKDFGFVDEVVTAGYKKKTKKAPRAEALINRIATAHLRAIVSDLKNKR